MKGRYDSTNIIRLNANIEPNAGDGLPNRTNSRHDTRMGLEVDRTVSGDTALAKGDWVAARSAFEAALSESDEPEARLGLGRALWWLQDIDGLLQVERGDRFEVSLRMVALPHACASGHCRDRYSDS